MGDFNIDLCKPKSVYFLNSVSSCGFDPTINMPTRITNTSMYLIENIFTYVNIIDRNVMVESAGILVSDITDHLPIFVKSYMTLKTDGPTSTFYTRNYSRDNIES